MVLLGCDKHLNIPGTKQIHMLMGLIQRQNYSSHFYKQFLLINLLHYVHHNILFVKVYWVTCKVNIKIKEMECLLRTRHIFCIFHYHDITRLVLQDVPRMDTSALVRAPDSFSRLVIQTVGMM